MSLSHLTATDAHVDGAGGSCDCTDEVTIPQDLTHQFRERVDLGRLKRLGLGDQVLVASGPSSRDQVDRDRGSTGAVIRRRELVDDRGHASRRVLRGLCVLDRFGRNQVLDGDCHIITPKVVRCSMCIASLSNLCRWKPR